MPASQCRLSRKSSHVVISSSDEESWLSWPKKKVKEAEVGFDLSNLLILLTMQVQAY
jgi:hypothetical protein